MQQMFCFGFFFSCRLTLQCITTTWRGSALSQPSMALQMVQILSRGGACMSGQPVSSVWKHKSEIQPDRNGDPHLCVLQTYLGVHFREVVPFLRQVDDLEDNKGCERCPLISEINHSVFKAWESQSTQTLTARLLRRQVKHELRH